MIHKLTHRVVFTRHFSSLREANSSVGKSTSTRSKLLLVVRAVRTFSPRTWVSNHPNTTYWLLFLVFGIYINSLLYANLSGLYPSYDEMRRAGAGRGLLMAKQQELADVTRYNNLVSQMRRDTAPRASV